MLYNREPEWKVGDPLKYIEFCWSTAIYHEKFYVHLYGTDSSTNDSFMYYMHREACAHTYIHPHGEHTDAYMTHRCTHTKQSLQQLWET